MRIIIDTAICITGLAALSSVDAGAQKRAAPVPAASVPAQDQAAIRAFLTRLYQTYRNPDPRQGWAEVIGKRQVFSPSTYALLNENARLLKGEMGTIEADIFCDCQDFGPSFRLVSTAFRSLNANHVNAKVVISNFGTKSLNIEFEKTAAGWRVYDVEVPQQGRLRQVLAKENAELGGSAARGSDAAVAANIVRQAPPGFPDRIEYMGQTGSDRYPVWNSLKLTHTGGVFSGSGFMQLGIFSGDAPLTGTYANGECTVARKSETYRGMCDLSDFRGTIYNKKGKATGQFHFISEAELERRKAGGITRASTQSFGSSAAAQPASYSVWALGRVRILTERGGRCGPDVNLGKAFCFDRGIDWLRRRPQKTELDVIAMDQSYMPGSMVPYNSGQGWSVYRVARRGEGFAADTQRHFATKVQVPQGCIYSGVLQNAWYITVAGGRKVAVEATQYKCSAAWAGPWLYARGADYADADAGQIDYAGTATAYRDAQQGGAGRAFQPNLAPGFGVPQQRGAMNDFGTSADIYGEPEAPKAPPRKRK